MAASVEAPLQTAPTFDQYSLPTNGCWQLGLAGAHQRVNASLAVQLAATWEHSCGSADFGAAQRVQCVQQLQLPDVYAAGLKECVWPGRAQVCRCCLLSPHMVMCVHLYTELKHKQHTSAIVLRVQAVPCHDPVTHKVVLGDVADVQCMSPGSLTLCIWCKCACVC